MALIGSYGDSEVENRYNGYGIGGSGSVYVFTRNNEGVWEQETKLLPDDNDIVYGLMFGRTVALYSSTAIIGSKWYPEEIHVGHQVGTAYVFTRDGNGLWSKQTQFLPDEAPQYGFSF